MAKELPYFRFTPQEWQNGDISLETYQLKGFFMDLCSYYWVKDCTISLEMVNKKFKGDEDLISSLIDLEIIYHDTETGFINISFLNEQFDILSELRTKRQDAGRKGGNKKASKAKANPEQTSEQATKIVEIVDYLNTVAKTNYRSSSQKTRSFIIARINEKYTVENFKKVIDTKVAEWIGTEYEKYLRPETLFSNKFENYLNQKETAKKPASKKPDLNTMNYDN